MIFDIGPFRLYRVEKNGTLDVSLKRMDSWNDFACGWEYGWRDDMRGTDKPLVEFRVGKLMILYVSPFKGGCEVWILGFYMFPTWGKRRKNER